MMTLTSRLASGSFWKQCFYDHNDQFLYEFQRLINIRFSFVLVDVLYYLEPIIKEVLQGGNETFLDHVH